MKHQTLNLWIFTSKPELKHIFFRIFVCMFYMSKYGLNEMLSEVGLKLYIVDAVIYTYKFAHCKLYITHNNKLQWAIPGKKTNRVLKNKFSNKYK